MQDNLTEMMTKKELILKEKSDAENVSKAEVWNIADDVLVKNLS